MFNSILFSSDMETLFLIDNGRAVEFPLTEQGVVVGLLNDQLSVVTAVKIPDPGEKDPETGGGPTPETPKADPVAKAALPLPDPPLFPAFMRISMEKSQWTLSFNPQSGYLFAIGATDIAFDRPELPVKPRVHIFALRKGVLRLAKKDKALHFSFLGKIGG